jgi:hypothetical protein
MSSKKIRELTRQDLKRLNLQELERERERLNQLNDLYRAEIDRAREKTKRQDAVSSALAEMWRDQMLKTDIFFAPAKDEQTAFYRTLLFVFWLSPRIRNAIIRELGPEGIGFASVRAFNVDRNARKAAVLETGIAEFKAFEKTTGNYRGSLHDAALERVGSALGMSANAVKVFLHRYRSLGRTTR